MSNPKAAIVVLNWNGRDDTLECIASLTKVSYQNLAVIMVDNGSEDGSVDAVRHRFPRVSIVQNARNLGYAGGNNRGIENALRMGAEYVLVLNNDTTVDPKLVDNLIASSARHPKAGILGAKIFYSNERSKIWYAGGRWDRKRLKFFHVGLNQDDAGGQFNRAMETDYVSGCALFARSEVFNKVGLFDEKFFLVFEETDFCYRARRAGFACMVEPEAKVWHKVSASFGGKGSPLYAYFSTRNRLLWSERHLPLTQLLSVYRRVLLMLVRGFGSSPMSPYPSRLVLPSQPSSEPSRSNGDPRFGRLTPVKRARLMGARDYILRRFGDCPHSVRLLGKQEQPW